jgi:hypothetical protein
MLVYTQIVGRTRKLPDRDLPAAARSLLAVGDVAAPRQREHASLSRGARTLISLGTSGVCRRRAEVLPCVGELLTDTTQRW